MKLDQKTTKCYVFKKEKELPANNPSNLNRYQQLINNDYNSKVDLLLVDVLKEDKKITDNRFNFY